jgi:hypothetical protein
MSDDFKSGEWIGLEKALGLVLYDDLIVFIVLLLPTVFIERPVSQLTKYQ